MRRIFFGVGLILMIALVILLGLLFYNNYTVLSPSDILISEGIEIEELEVDKITIRTFNSDSEEMEITDEKEISSILEEVLGIKAKRDILYEYKMRIFGSASRHRADYKIGEAIEFNGICNNTGLNVNMLIIHGTYRE